MKLHLANTNLAPLPLPDALRAHPGYLQLQYLPLLWADPDDAILVTEKPAIPGNFILYSEEAPVTELDLWARTPATTAIAAHFGLPDPSCPLPTKEWVWEHAPLEGRAFLPDLAAAEAYVATGPYPKVLKSPEGHAARGLRLFHKKGPITLAPPLVGEPWFPRKRDFSTQWHIGETIDFLGHCHLQNSERGAFQAAITGKPEPLLDAHIDAALPLLQKVQALGFRGELGIDALVSDTLYPIVEINPRKTMGWVALQVAKKQRRPIRLTCGVMNSGLLPSRGRALNVFVD